MRTLVLWIVLLLLAVPAMAQTPVTEETPVDAPALVLQDIGFRVSLPAAADSGRAPVVQVAGAAYPMAYDADAGAWVAEEVTVPASGINTVSIQQNNATIAQTSTRAIPGWLSIVPPLLAIAMALVFKRVVPSLFFGVWIGAWIALGGAWSGLWQGMLDAFQVYVLTAMANPDHAAIILFSLMIGGMVGIISKNGGTYGIVNWIIEWAKTPKRGQVATSVLGIAIFFDDYANTLVVGNTMRPVTDRLRISREKLAYIVDSTAAPVSSLALVTTWIGFEVGLINDALATIAGLNMSGYTVFLESLLYRFYPWLALFFVFAIALTDREFGPMRLAEQRARTTGQVLGPDAKVDKAVAEEEDGELAPKEGQPQRAVNAILPVVVLVGAVLVFLYTTGVAAVGADAGLRDIIGAADSYKALMWGSLLGVFSAAALSIGQRILTLEETVEAWYGGLKSMLFAMIILVLAWALSEITTVLHTAEYLVSVLGETLPPGIVPAIVFVLAAATAFATGSSWGTMGILMPLVVPLTWAVMDANGVADPAHYYILYSSVSCILAGAVWGDHCSPISDTTILSSMASGCDHIEHVRTQLPYAFVVGIVGLLLGTVPTGFGFPWWLSMLICAAVLWGLLWFIGTPLEHYNRPPSDLHPSEPAATTTA